MSALPPTFTIDLKCLKLVSIASILFLSLADTANCQVRIFGTLDAGVERIGGADHNGNTWRLSSGSGRTSRIVFEGLEMLSPELSAKFFLDIGFWADSGANYPTGPGVTGIFGRRSIIAIQDKNLGSITLGREYTPQFWLSLKTDIAGNAYYGNATTRFRLLNARASNAIEYTSPNIKGFTATALASMGGSPSTGGDESKQAPFSEGRQRAISLDYNHDNLYVAIAYGTVDLKPDALALRTKQASEMSFGLKYKMDGVSINFGYHHGKPVQAKTDIEVFLLGVMKRLTPQSQVGVQVSQSSQLMVNSPKASEMVISAHYNYDLSARTMLYLNLAQQNNNAYSQQALIASIGPNVISPKYKGAKMHVMLLGMSHNF
jgi:predicted porin